ncbi:MAG: metallophosphoesterase [Methanobrevibacter sp.]|nr:metallophosphoesterase [Methanobrevibacter sp.]
MKSITTADWHLRYTVPSCMDMTETEWMNAQKEALNQVEKIAVEKEVEAIYIGGDLFHSENSTSFECIYLLQDFAERMAAYGIKVYILAGNHDLPKHSSENIPKSAIGVLLNSKNILNMNDDSSKIKGCNFDKDDYGNAQFIFKHVLTIPTEEKADFIECETPETLLGKYPDAKFIFTGDFHKNFVHATLDNRFVVNSGCLLKQAVDFEDYQNGVYFVDTDDNYVEWCPVNVEYKFNHQNQAKKEIDSSIEKFATGIKKESITLDYISSLRNELPNHEQPVQNKVTEWITQIGQ